MKVLITGSNGQLGRALQTTAPATTELTAVDSQRLDIVDADAVRAFVAGLAPDLIINAAAYTAVDRAEDDEARATALNATAVRHLAIAANAVGARLIHVSTDFVFDGTSSRPIPPEAVPNPRSAYGRTKLAGEIAAGSTAMVVRTAWVYGSQGHNFVRTMLRLMAERETVSVVADQIGTPTWATSLAEALWSLDAAGETGLHHFTDSGVASWYDFAVAIQEEAVQLGLLNRAVPIIPVATHDYPTPAIRPAYSVLDKTKTFAAIGGPAPHWRVNLRRMLEELHRNG